MIGHWELCNGGCRKAKEDQDEADGCEATQEYLHQRWKEEMRSDLERQMAPLQTENTKRAKYLHQRWKEEMSSDLKRQMAPLQTENTEPSSSWH